MRISKRRSRKRVGGLVDGILVGVLSGGAVVCYRLGLEMVARWTGLFRLSASSNRFLLFLFFCFLFLGGWAVGIMVRWEPLTAGSGIPHVKGVLQGALPSVWWRILLVKFAGGLLGIGAGLSLGREGPSVQIGAMVGQGWGTYRRDRNRIPLFVTAGASAGIAASFGAPLSGVVFALEELHRGFSSLVLVASMTASLTADVLSRSVFGMEPILDFHLEHPFPLHQYGLILLLALLLGVLGVVFNRVLLETQDFFLSLRWVSPSFQPVPIFILAGVLGFVFPQVLGGGHHLIASLPQDPYPWSALLLLVLVKFWFTMGSYASSTPGGIFFPLLTIGALLGGLWGKLFTGVMSLDFVALGMAGYFSAITRAPLTGILLILELTGSWSHLPVIALTCLLAYVVADLLGGKLIYDVLLKRLEARYSPGEGLQFEQSPRAAE
ncbi:MAG: ClC family H(+)/Cl(-) exchange transporter [Atribacterota bacterium]